MGIFDTAVEIAFDDGAADALISAADSADQILRSEGGFLGVASGYAMEDFKGGCATLFATTENPMTGSANPSDPATVKAQVEELKQALGDLHAFKTETQQAIGPQKWVDKGTSNMDCRTSDGQDGVNYSILTQTPDPVDLEASVTAVKTFWESKGFTTHVESSPKEASASASPITKSS